MKSYKIIFAGTPDFAAHALDSLIKSDHQVVAVYTQPDRPAGRGRKLVNGPVKSLALAHNIPVEQPLSFKETPELEKLKSYQADLLIVAAYGLILPLAVLNTPSIASLNIHASLLPRWRGAAPIQRAIAAGDKQTGITIMEMAEGLDTGDMLLKESVGIEKSDTGSVLHDKLADLGAKACLAALEQLDALLLSKTQQSDADACYAHKLNKQDAIIDWTQNTQDILAKIRAFNAWPVASTVLGNQNLRIWQAETDENDPRSSQDKTTEAGDKEIAGTIVSLEQKRIKVSTIDGYIFLTRLQLPGGKALDSGEILNSKKDLFQPGTRLGISTS